MAILLWVLAGIVALALVGTVIAMCILADRADEVMRDD
jgi:hypothetical protein